MEKTKVAAIFSTQLSISMASILIASLQVVNFGIESKIVFQQQWHKSQKQKPRFVHQAEVCKPKTIYQEIHRVVVNQ